MSSHEATAADSLALPAPLSTDLCRWKKTVPYIVLVSLYASLPQKDMSSLKLKSTGICHSRWQEVGTWLTFVEWATQRAYRLN